MGVFRLAAALALVVVAAACGDRSVDAGAVCALPYTEQVQYYPQSSEKDIDILIVLDTSPAMAPNLGFWWKGVTSVYGKLIDGLKSPQLNNKIPDVHIGVISADLGAGSYSGVPGCKPGGHGAKLQNQPGISGCIMPKDPWISYVQGVTNIDNPAVKDPIERVKGALQCFGFLTPSTTGCPFSQPLEAARRALDPKLNLHPGFLRKGAFLYLLFITAGDDCSAQKPQLFDPSQTKPDDPLGPLSTYRCFEFGVSCDCQGGATCHRTTPGPRKNCKPSGNWLYPVQAYVDFFKALKPPGRVIASVVSGPTDKVEVQLVNGLPTLMPSCQTTVGSGTPAIRLKAFASALKGTGNKGYFNEGTDSTRTQVVPVTVCSPQLIQAVWVLSKLFVSVHGSRCLLAAPLTEDCGLACAKGVVRSGKATCSQSCLHRADCAVTAFAPLYDDTGQKPRVVARCPRALFDDPDNKSCGSTCPCWRLVAATKCSPKLDGSPYQLQILRSGAVAKGEVVAMTCATSLHAWGSAGSLALPECAPASP